MLSKILTEIISNAKSFPNRIALIGDNKEVTYQSLIEQIFTLSEDLQSLNCSKVALIADNSIEWVIFDLACLKAAVTLIPLPHFFTLTQLAEIIASEEISTIFCDKSPFSKSLIPPSFAEEKTIFKSFSLFKNNVAADIKSEIAKITFTSGSTANPKPIELSSQNIDQVVFSLLAEIGSKNIKRNLAILPLSILLENIAGVYLPLVSGGCAIIKSLEFIGISNSSGLNITSFAAAISFINPSSFILSPELAKILIGLVREQKISPINFKFIAVGGAKIAADLLQEAQDLHIPIFQGYGLSELCSVVSLNNIAENKMGSVGKILPHLEVKILNEEILIKGASLAQNIELDPEGFYATGDLGYLDKEGFLFVRGRKKNIFITSMMRNINPEWIESEILKSSLIAQTAVFGEAMPINSAIIVLARNNISYQDVQSEIDKINQTLPDYAQVKKIIIADDPFNQKNNLLTGNGRIKRDNIWMFYKDRILN